MFKKIIAALLLMLSINLSSCISSVAGLQSYVNSLKGYEFLYPNGWVPVDVKQASEGVDVVFRDIVERTENLSVIISSVPEEKTVAELGTPSEVGYRFLQIANSNANANRQAEFLSAESHEKDGKTYYTLEYQVKLPDDQERHNLASVAVSRGKLFTFNLSTRQGRWPKVSDSFRTIVDSFSVY
ncbi:MAG: photosystem II reaction center PsbP [Cyanophyceae cyanobacterium]